MSESLIEIETLAGLAVFAFAVSAFHAGYDAREFGAGGGIGGRGDGKRSFAEMEILRARSSGSFKRTEAHAPA